MNATTTHPTPHAIRDFSHGRLSEAESEAVESHVAECEACSLLLHQQPPDALLILVRQPASAVQGPARQEADTAPEGATLPELPPPIAPEVPAALLGHPRYRVLRPLGSGGMGTVFLAEHVKMARQVALKVIRGELLSRPDALSRFEKEVLAAAKLQHPNIVQAFDADQAEGLNFLVMEFVEGTDVARHLETNGPLPVAEACEIVRQAAAGLQHAHEKGMVHRDIKPHNLMLTPQGQVKILDFGLARFAQDQGRDAEGQLTGSVVVVGTADYIAPEQTRGARHGDIRADVYSLGCTLYQLLTGRVPYPEGTAVDKMLRHSLDVPVPLASRRPGLPAGLVAVVERMMAKEPARRFQTPEQVAQALVPFTSVGSPLTSPPGRWLPFLAVALGAVLTFGFLVAFVLRLSTDEGDVVVSFSVERVPKSARPGKWDGGAELPSRTGFIRTVQRPSEKTDAQPIISSDGRLLGVFADTPQHWSGELRVVEVATGKVIHELRHRGHTITHAAFTPDGKYVLTGMTTDQKAFTYWLWDLETGEHQVVEQIAAVHSWPSQFHFSANGKRFVTITGAPDGIRDARAVYDFASGKMLVRIDQIDEAPVVVAVLSADGARAVSTHHRGYGKVLPETRCEIRVTDLDAGKSRVIEAGPITAGDLFVTRGTGEIGGVCQDAERRLSVRYWDPVTLKMLRQTPIEEAELASTACTPDGRRFLVVGIRGEEKWVARVLAEDAKEVFQAPLTPGQTTLSDDGRVLLTWDDAEVRLYRLPDVPPAKKP